MLPVPGLRFVYEDQQSKMFYKKNQSFESYTYYDCYKKKCSGRSNIKGLMKKHTCARDCYSKSNSMELMKFKKKLLVWALDPEFDKLSCLELYKVAIEKFDPMTAPPHHQKECVKAIRNARYRTEKRGK